MRETSPRDVVIFAATFSACTIHTFAIGDVSCLLGPVRQRHLTSALSGFSALRDQCPRGRFDRRGRVLRILHALSDPIGHCHAHFLVSINRELVALPIDSITCFCSRGQIAFTIAQRKERCVMSFSLSGLKRRLSPSGFFHAGQRALMRVGTVHGVRPCFRGGMIMRIIPPFGSGVLMDGRGVTSFGI